MTELRLSELGARLHRQGLLASEPLPAHAAESDPLIGGVRYDSRKVRPGDLFVARRGQHADGHEHVAEAVDAGATAVLVERPVPGITVPELITGDAKVALGIAASWHAGDPSHALGIVGITGTDGKTTTAYLVQALLEGAGGTAGLLGTTDVIAGGRSLGNAARTSTPEAPELQAHLAAMRAAGDRWAVVESSSHGLAQQRVRGTAYDVAVLTNVTSEHLEFHGTLHAYKAAKRSLFALLAVGEENPDKGWGKHAVVNADDPEGEPCAAVAREAGARVVRYGLGGEADIVATGLEETPSGLRVAMRSGSWAGTVPLQLAGRFNVANALAAMGVAVALELDLDRAAASLSALPAVPGRMQRVDEGQPFTVVIDYAHTAESLAKVLEELAPSDPRGRLIVVFGSAGDRDPSKRGPMGRAAGERAGLVIVTDEDPRGEDREAIIEAIARGAEAAGKRRGEDLLLVPDRAQAITEAVRRARPHDVLLLAGKGHEKTIETATGELPWDEAETAREALRALRA
ncbi:MAG: UDP-N-acetylmuramoyl-L-alanyl-D-glutamate--2,6-diaminopimelate ligase [Candidatus Limnocylindrales bacterium]